MDPIIPKKLYIINIGIRLFYETAIQQHIEAVHINWLPPPPSEDIDEEILNRIGDE